MSWLPKGDKLDPVQASAVDFAVAQEGKKKVEKVGGGGGAVAGTGKSVVRTHVAAKLARSVRHLAPVQGSCDWEAVSDRLWRRGRPDLDAL